MPLNPDENLLNEYVKNRKIKVFIETGTADGDGVQCALDAGFEKIYSIELNSSLFEKCKKRFENNENVNLICGSSEIELPKILENIDESFVLWLDAHFSGGDYIGELMDIYLPKEITSIIKFSKKFENSVVMIDDMNHFKNNNGFYNQIENLINQLKGTGEIRYYDYLCPTHLVSTYLIKD